MNRPNDEDYNFYEDNGNSNGQNDSFENGSGFGGGAGQNPGGQNNYAYEVLMRPKSRVWSVVAIVFGILSILCCCMNYIGIIVGALSIVFAIISRKKLGYFDTTSIVAIIVAIFGIVLSLAVIIVSVVVVNSPEYIEMIQELESLYGMDLNGDGLVNGIPVDQLPGGGTNNPNEF